MTRPPYRAVRHLTEETRLLFCHDGTEHYYRITRTHVHNLKPGPWFITRADGYGNSKHVGDDAGYRTVAQCEAAVNKMEGIGQ